MDRRDQVLITFFLPPSFIFSIFLSSFSSTYGPFFRDLGIRYYFLRFTIISLDFLFRFLVL